MKMIRLLSGLFLVSAALADQAPCPSSFDQGREIVCPVPLISNASAQVQTTGWDVNISASLLVWQVLGEAMGYAIETNHIEGIDDLLLSVTAGSYVNLQKPFKPAFRVGLGFAPLSPDDWAINAEYSHLRSYNTGKKTSLEQSYYQTWRGGFNDFASTARGAWKFHFDQIDLYLAREYHVSPRVIFRPHVGGRTLWIDQAYRASYGFFDDPAHVANANVKSDAWGMGLLMGVDSSILLPKGFLLIGNIALSDLYTRYRMSLSSQDDSTPNTFLYNRIGNRECWIHPNMNMAAGLGWESCLFCNRIYVNFSATYEFHVFWDANMLRTYQAAIYGYESGPRNIYIHGLALTGVLDF